MATSGDLRRGRTGASAVATASPINFAVETRGSGSSVSAHLSVTASQHLRAVATARSKRCRGHAQYDPGAARDRHGPERSTASLIQRVAGTDNVGLNLYSLTDIVQEKMHDHIPRRIGSTAIGDAFDAATV
jgi:hypothetical protein